MWDEFWHIVWQTILNYLIFTVNELLVVKNESRRNYEYTNCILKKKKIMIASMGAHHPSMDGIVCTLPVWIDFEFSFHGNFKFLSYLDYIWSLVR